MGADTRATAGPIVADKNCEKIHYIAPNIYCCGAGTAADTENITKLISSNLRLQRLNAEGRQSRLVTAMTMLKQKLFKYVPFFCQESIYYYFLRCFLNMRHSQLAAIKDTWVPL